MNSVHEIIERIVIEIPSEDCSNVSKEIDRNLKAKGWKRLTTSFLGNGNVRITAEKLLTEIELKDRNMN